MLRKPTPLAVVLVFWGSLALPCLLHAQDDGRDDEAVGIVQLFGQGNGLRGLVITAQSGSFMIRTDDGESYKVFWSPNTRFMKDRQPTEANAVHVGDMLVAAGRIDRNVKTMGAVFLYDLDPEEVRKARAGFGKTWIAGKVSAIHDLRITIKRADNQVAESIAVDENTSFRHRRESVTLADVKVGDFISVQGTIRNETFVAGVLRVMEPNAGSDSGLSGVGPPDF